MFGDSMGVLDLGLDLQAWVSCVAVLHHWHQNDVLVQYFAICPFVPQLLHVLSEWFSMSACGFSYNCYCRIYFDCCTYSDTGGLRDLYTGIYLECGDPGNWLP